MSTLGFHGLYIHILVLASFYFGRACLPDGKSNSGITRGKSTYVCLTMGPRNWSPSNTSYVRVAAEMPADEYSSINIKDSWTSATYSDDTVMQQLGISDSVDDGLAIGVESMGIYSFQKVYRTNKVNVTTAEKAGYTYPLLMAVIEVDHGKVKSIDWDEGCKWCGDNECDSNTYYYNGVPFTEGGSCALRDELCVVDGVVNATSNALCQLNVYVVWSGTDSRGQYFRSAASRFSRFLQTQVTQYTDILRDEVAYNTFQISDDNGNFFS